MEPRTHWLAPRSEAPAPYDAPPPYEPRPISEAEPPELGPPLEPRRRSGLRRTLGPIIAAIVAFAAKFKALILLLPKIKLLATAGTMFVSLAAYAWLWGWQFAAGFIALLFVHEMGHVIQLRREGIRASAPMFIPFFGAVVTARSLGDNATAEARVGLAGPIVGSLGAAACILVWHATGNDMWRALAFTGFLLNLFNLIPVVPLDGGRAMAAMAPWMWFVGLLALIPLLIIFPNPIFLLILVFAGFETYKRWQARRAGGEAQRAYYRVRPLDRALVAAVYLSLVALLVMGMHATNLPRTFG
jgi:Zn-dependent protease